MTPQLQHPIENDNEYLRDDSEFIDDFLKDDKQRVLTAAAPRRFGKTSFLLKIGRRAKEQGWATHFVTLDAGVADLAKVFGAGEVNELAAMVWCSQLTAPTLLLIDEPNAAVFPAGGEDAEVVKILNTLLLQGERDDIHLKITFAEVEPFYQRCSQKCESLGERLPMAQLYRLRAVTDARKREWLGESANLR